MIWIRTHILIRTNICMKKFWFLLHHFHRNNTAYRTAQQNELLSPKIFKQIFRQLNSIMYKQIKSETSTSFYTIFTECFSSTPWIPLNNGKMFFPFTKQRIKHGISRSWSSRDCE